MPGPYHNYKRPGKLILCAKCGKIYRFDSAARHFWGADCERVPSFAVDGQESFKLYDYLRIDHFKGFSDFWEIPGGDETAENGEWVPGPGYDLFKVVKKELGDLNIIAEDLGNIDDKTRQLLADCGYPGMKIVQFGFYDTTGNSIDIPHVYTQHSVAYTGTHDNEVINGWYDNLTQEQRDYTDAYINRRQGEPDRKSVV